MKLKFAKGISSFEDSEKFDKKDEPFTLDEKRAKYLLNLSQRQIVNGAIVKTPIFEIYEEPAKKEEKK